MKLNANELDLTKAEKLVGILESETMAL